MRTIGYILQKEFLQIFRNRTMLPLIFVMPLVQLVVLAFAATFEVKHSAISVEDLDGSTTSMRLVQQIQASNNFEISAVRYAPDETNDDLLLRRSNVILRIPPQMGVDLAKGRQVSVQVVVNAEDGAAAGVVNAYLMQIFGSFNRNLTGSLFQNGMRPSEIAVRSAFWYNEELNYRHFMVPGILVLLITMIGTMLSAMNVVREKEIGTAEQLNVTPIRKGEFIIGKLMPFWIIGLLELSFGLTVAWLIFRVPMRGNLFLLFGLAGVFLLVILGLGLLVSTVTDTQQQAMFISWFVLVLFILLSGLFTPIESMPNWAQKVTLVNPLAHFIEIMRRVLLKGAGFAAVKTQFLFLASYAIVLLTLATRQYKKFAN